MLRQAVPFSDDIREGMTTYLDEMMTRLAFCLAVERDRHLQAAIRKVADCAGNTPLYVMPSPTRAWLLLEENRPVRLIDDVQDGVRRLAMNDLDADHEIWREVFSAIERIRADERAWKLLAPIFNAGVSPTANQIAKLLKWAPVVEIFAYQCFTTATMLLDGMRRRLLTTPLTNADRERTLVDYWITLHTMGHLLTIASSPAARPWLAEMASSFTWTQWTPSFVLSRERTLWLMAAAAKSAVAFGESVIDRYLSKLSRSDHPLKSFDSLLGLVSIGLDRPDLAPAVISEIEDIGASKARDSDRSYSSVTMFASAIETLREPQFAEKHFDRYSRNEAISKLRHPKLMGLDALRLDSTETIPGERLLGLVALPSIVRAPLGEYYPRQNNSLLLPPQHISLILERAWAAASLGSDQRVLH